MSRSSRSSGVSRLFLDLFVVILGISISLMLQDWMQGRADRRTETRLLESFVADLRADLSGIQKRVGRLTEAIECVEALRRPETVDTLEATALDLAMDHLMGYTSFGGSMATYLEVRQTGASSLILNKPLLRRVIWLYERAYPTVAEWDSINRGFVLDRLIPYVDEFGPDFVTEQTRAFADGYHLVARSLVQETRFRNLVRSSVLFKQGQRKAYTNLEEAVQEVLAFLESEVSS